MAEDMKSVRIRRLRDYIGKRTIAEFAAAHQIDPTYLSQLLNGHRPVGEKAARGLEESIGVPPRYLDNDEAPLEPMPRGWYARQYGEDQADLRIAEDQRAYEARRDQQTSQAVAAQPSLLDKYDFVSKVNGPKLVGGRPEVIWDLEEVDYSHGFRKEWMRSKGYKPERCKLIEVEGSSMEPTLNPGDLVLINMADREIHSGEVYALVASDGLRVKRLIVAATGTITMRSDNPEQHKYPPEEIRDNSAAVIGRVVWKGGEL